MNNADFKREKIEYMFKVENLMEEIHNLSAEKENYLKSLEKNPKNRRK